MDIEIYQLVEGARKATGLTVVIDVFRAFSLEPYLFSQGVEKIYPVGAIEDAYRLKEEHPDFLLVGERHERKPEGFDFGNSPHQSFGYGLSGKSVIHTTSAGTQGIVNAVNADEIVTGSFVNAGAIIRYIQKQKPGKVSLCCMGYASQRPTEEDSLCAEYIKSVLIGDSPNYEEMVSLMRTTSGRRFFIDENQSFAPKEDFFLCTKLSIFDFILKVSFLNEQRVITKQSI